MSDKFKHLDNIKPRVSSFEDFKKFIPELDEERLPDVRNLFELYANNADSEIVEVAVSVIEQIDELISNKNIPIRSEILRAANDDNYSLAA